MHALDRFTRACMYLSTRRLLQSPGHDCICKSVRSGQYCMADTIASDTGLGNEQCLWIPRGVRVWQWDRIGTSAPMAVVKLEGCGKQLWPGQYRLSIKHWSPLPWREDQWCQPSGCTWLVPSKPRIQTNWPLDPLYCKDKDGYWFYKTSVSLQWFHWSNVQWRTLSVFWLVQGDVRQLYFWSSAFV